MKVAAPKDDHSHSASIVAAVPYELRGRRQWIGYRLSRRNRRRTKVPWRCDGRGPARVDDSTTWTSFERAVGAFDRGFVDGVGFVFTADDPYGGADLDDCIAAGRLHPAAAEVVAALDSYTERSPSGKGVHVLVKGALAADARNRTEATGWDGRLELYDRRHFFCVTGDHLPGAPKTIEARQAELDAVVAELLPAPPRRPSPGPQPALALDDKRLLAKARRARNGSHFVRLYDVGDWSGYLSQSEAELALCSILAFWTGGDVERIDSLFRRGALFREKWEKRSYREATLAQAIAGCPTYYRRASVS
jgi:primase-polymerase (primpol)-like protein